MWMLRGESFIRMLRRFNGLRNNTGIHGSRSATRQEIGDLITLLIDENNAPGFVFEAFQSPRASRGVIGVS
jgi:hypothetical protein